MSLALNIYLSNCSQKVILVSWVLYISLMDCLMSVLLIFTLASLSVLCGYMALTWAEKHSLTGD